MPNIETFLPYLQVATATTPFAAALMLRILLGGNRVTRLLVSGAVLWFAVNVFLSPFTDIPNLERWFR